jgi:hypothetical protein
MRLKHHPLIISNNQGDIEIYSKWEIQPTSNKDPNITRGHPQFYSKSNHP